MRIISGAYKGRNIYVAKNLIARPTTDFAREALFNILSHQYTIEDAVVLDLFAGTGAVSLEFVSRGAKKVIAVEKNSRCIKSIWKNIDHLQITNLSVKQAAAKTFANNCTIQFNFIFADPPYDLNEIQDIPNWIFDNDLLAPDGIFILEHSARTSFSNHERFSSHRKYGNVNFSIFQ